MLVDIKLTKRWSPLIIDFLFFSVCAAKKNITLNPSDLVFKLAKFISDRIEEKRRLAKKLKIVIEDQYKAFQQVPHVQDRNLNEVGLKQCCRYDGNKARYSNEFYNWVDTQSVSKSMDKP